MLPPTNEVCYRPQTKFAKVMFLHLSVILSTGGSTWAGTPLGRYTPGQVHPPRRYTPSSGQVHPLGRYPPGQVHHPATVYAGIWSTSGRYASHSCSFFLSLFKICTNVNIEIQVSLYPSSYHLTDHMN